jgi:hypothetical protein
LPVTDAGQDTESYRVRERAYLRADGYTRDRLDGYVRCGRALPPRRLGQVLDGLSLSRDAGIAVTDAGSTRHGAGPSPSTGRLSTPSAGPCAALATPSRSTQMGYLEAVFHLGHH